MVKLWQRYLDLFPSSKFAAQARDRQSRWSDRCQEEIKRGFQVFIDEAYVRLIKGPSHQLAGRPWDPEIFGQNAAPDPYALLVMNDEVVGYTPVARDAFHPVWKLGSDVLRVSDTQQLTIVIRDRDIAEKAVIALLGTSLFTFSGIQSARAALKEDHDDNIGKWIGTINELMKQGQNGSLQAGDFKQLKVRVIRPQ
jgi:hypothetical protein